jgi:hypothetical protein
VVINKIVAPSKLCCEPYLTEWHANLEIGMQIWIQTSQDPENPKWIRLGDLYEATVAANKTSDTLTDWIASYNNFPS